MSAYSQLVLADRPVGYWRLNETSGTTAADSSGNGHDGTYNGGFTLNQAGALLDDSSPSVLLNGTTGYLSTDLGGPVPVAYEMWFKPTSAINASAGAIPLAGTDYASGSTIEALYLGSVTGSFNNELVTVFNRVASGDDRFRYYADANRSLAGWNHLVWQWVNGAWEIWLNGEQVDNGSFNGNAAWRRTTTYFGFGAGAYFPGSIQDAAVYLHSLSGDRIIAHYTEGRVKGYEDEVMALGPIRYFPLNDPAGAAYAVDLSGHEKASVNGAGATLGVSGGLPATVGTALSLAGGSTVGRVSIGCSSGGNAAQQELNTALRGDHTMLVRVQRDSGASLRRLLGRSPAGIAVLLNYNAGSGVVQAGTLSWYDDSGGGADGNALASSAGVIATTTDWYDVVFTRAGNTGTIYVNGVAVGTRTFSAGSPVSGTADFEFGGSNSGSPGSTYLDGDIQHAAILGRGVTAAEVRRLYAARLIPPLKSRLFA
jgi:hypothetical protein